MQSGAGHAWNIAHPSAAFYPVLDTKPHPLAVYLSYSFPLSATRRGGQGVRPRGQGVSLRPRLVRRRPVDGRHFAARHAQVHRELAAVVHHVHQQEPQEVHATDVAHLLGSDVELHGLVQLRVSRVAHLVGERLERPLALGHDAVPLLGLLRHVLRRERQLAVHPLRAAIALEPERPGAALRRTRFVVRLQVRLRPRVGPEHFDRGGGFPLEGVQVLLLLAHMALLMWLGRLAGVRGAAILVACPTLYTGSCTSPRASSPGTPRRWTCRATVPIGNASAASSPAKTTRDRSCSCAPSSTTGKNRSPTR